MMATDILGNVANATHLAIKAPCRVATTGSNITLSGVQAIDGPFLGLGDRLALARAARAARELGFDGKWAIHPEQVEPLNRAFGATEPELRWAGAVTEALARFCP